MAATVIIHTTTTGWLNLDAWSETYIAAHWLVTNELPAHEYQSETHHGPLSQMVLIAAHQLIEIMFFQCVRVITDGNPKQFTKIENKYQNTSFKKALEEWPEIITGTKFDLTQEPLKSADHLRARRNATVHKRSALTSLEMARSALFSAVEASKAISEHLLGEAGFKYNSVLYKYPLKQEQWFSQVKLINEAT
ncbi:hypothetical protein JWV26_18415 [Ectopseudomonas toyotomiensis]|uniref:RiboL-PSP-HEPN domain-containing protein n=1 Tax=Ectopseudomonas toyotomiensis TaxID=554344 RepID=A0ABD7DTG7_9GAMM|nr:hypothetical protein [Pseudomonas toyotomiensis]QSL91721.1 hypothetical protein JWV26_18415 [Pseudomonas toyotomiensis]